MIKKSLTRRHFLTLSSRGIGLAVVSSGLSGCLGGDLQPVMVSPGTTTPPAPAPEPTGTFAHGVASGDPTQSAVILWTRITPDDASSDISHTVAWEVAEDSDFNNLVRSGSTEVTSASDYTLKVDAVDLTPGTTYYYRFMNADRVSTVGTTKTLPEGAVEQVNMAVFSCSNYPAGYFNVYDLAARQSDIDVVVHLGDYIYEYDRDGYASANAAALGREVLPANEIVSLSDYRTRYAQYRSDASLQKLHAKVPFIAVWDDHEVTNDAYRDGAENHQPEEGDYEARKMVALQTYFEWMPIRPVIEGDNEVINRSFQFGDLVDLHMLDTRIIGRDKQLDILDYVDPATGALNGAQFEADVTDPNRTLLGANQLQWLQASMAGSTGTWQVLGQQVLMGRMLLPAAIATQQLSIQEYAELGQLATIGARLQAGDPTLTQAEIDYFLANQDRLTPQALALLQLPNIPYNLDAWDGYAAEREMVLGTAKQLGKNLVVLAGDTHNAWGNNLRDFTGEMVGVELATASVSSPGLEVVLGLSEADIPATEAGVVQLVEDLQYFNTSDRGFMFVSFTPEKVRAVWRFVDTVSSTTYFEKTGRRQVMESMAGQPGLTQVS